MKKRLTVPFFTLSLIVLVAISLFFYLIYRQKAQTTIYVVVSLLRPSTLSTSIPYNWIPYWISDAIARGDKDINPFGQQNGEVIEKDVLIGPSYGKFTYLTVRLRVLRDRSGIFLFKNKPVSVGNTLSFQFPKAQVDGMVTEISTSQPVYEYKTIHITLRGRTLEEYFAKVPKAGSVIKNDASQEIAKITAIRAVPARVRIDYTTYLPVPNMDEARFDVEYDVDLRAKKVGPEYFFAQTQKIKVGDPLFLPFSEVNLNIPVVRIQS